MTTLKFSVDDELYKRMKAFPKVDWDGFLNKAIELRLKQIENWETDITTLLSAELLKENWESPEDMRWEQYV